MNLPNKTRLALTPLLAVGLVVLVSACGASFDSGEPAVSPTPSSGTQAAVSPHASPSSCVNPATKADYTLAGARLLPGNLQVKDLKVGTGATAKLNSTVSVTYVGKLANGTVFDSSGSARSSASGWAAPPRALRISFRSSLPRAPASNCR